MEGNTYSIQLTEIKKKGIDFTCPMRPLVCVCVCKHMCVPIVDTCGAIMTALAHLCLRIAPGYWCALVRHVAG